MPRTDWFHRYPEMERHERTCQHCRSFRRKVADGEFAPAGVAVDCRYCGHRGEAVLDERYGPNAPPRFRLGHLINRCARCGTPTGEMHVVELFQSELPDAGLQTIWGSSDLWQCSQGCQLEGPLWDYENVTWEEETDNARAHADANGGVFLPELPSSSRTIKRTGGSAKPESPTH